MSQHEAAAEALTGLAPLAVVGAAGGPGFLPVAPHVALHNKGLLQRRRHDQPIFCCFDGLMKLTEILAAVAPNVVALASGPCDIPAEKGRVWSGGA